MCDMRNASLEANPDRRSICIVARRFLWEDSLPKISIVIPVWNAQDHLRACLDSVIGQTLRDIEVICVDDASSDGSPEILREYELGDPRVRVITYADNVTASRARKDGVLASTGAYVMFVDNDDTIEPDTCERLYASVQAEPVDILHFGTSITTVTDLPPERIRWMEEFIKPYDGVLQGDEVLAGAFSENRLYNFTVWDKLYSAELCKKSFGRVMDDKLPRGEDKYAYFILSYFAQTYRGMPDQVLYHYYFGRGSTGHNLLTLAQFENFCSLALAADAIRDFLAEEGALQSHQAIYLRARSELLQDCVNNWNKHLAEGDKAAGFDLMLKYWRAPEVVAKMAELNGGDQDQIAALLKGSKSTRLPKISVVVPVHNSQAYLAESLDSLLEQTLDDIEVICIDDASDDTSPVILQQYALRDPRVFVITYQENKSASQARKDGVLASTGTYVMFLDADDTVAPDACERLYAAMQADPVDILHFGTRITTDANLPADRIGWMEEFVKPYDGVLQGDEILQGAFSEDRLYNFTLWDKVYAADLCRKSFARLKDGSFPKAQDKYAYFILSYFAQSYRGIPSEVFYTYNFGRGVTGHNLLSMAQFERYCSMARVADAIKSFLMEDVGLQRNDALYRNVRDQLLRDCVGNWNKHLAATDKAAGFDLMLRYWQAPEVIAKIAELNWDAQGHIARLLKDSASIVRAPHTPRVVGTYYHRAANGGTQRILSVLIQLWVDLGYEVVLFTDLPPSPDDYDLPASVRRVVLPSFFDISPRNYADRAYHLNRAIREYGIDAMVYHAWVSRLLLWDLLVCKTAGAAFITHCHSAFSQPTRNVRTYFADMPSVYHLSDAAIVLSEVDRAYWKNFNGNVVTVVNPLTFSLSDLEVSALEGQNVLWLGRMSDEKRPHEALKIFAKVLEDVPDANLLMVGESADQEYMEGVHALVDELGIRDSVTMCGFHKDVLPFYGKTAALLMTSEFEGFSLVLAESQSAGVPCVMYDLPYLTLTRSRKGFIAVELGDTNAAADGLVTLLREPDLRRAMGRDARANIEELSEFDFAGTWSGVFDSLAHAPILPPRDETTRIMWETLMDHYRGGAVRKNREVARLKRQLAVARRTAKKQTATRKELRRVRASWSFRLGYAITSIPRRIRKVLNRGGSDNCETP